MSAHRRLERHGRGIAETEAVHQVLRVHRCRIDGDAPLSSGGDLDAIQHQAFRRIDNRRIVGEAEIAHQHIAVQAAGTAVKDQIRIVILNIFGNRLRQLQDIRHHQRTIGIQHQGDAVRRHRHREGLGYWVILHLHIRHRIAGNRFRRIGLTRIGRIIGQVHAIAIPDTIGAPANRIAITVVIPLIEIPIQAHAALHVIEPCT